MNVARFLPRLSLLFLTTLFLSACQSGQETTTVYLVRHAEKDMADPSAKNPPLTPAGLTRAQHLADRFKSTPLDAIFSTSFDRNMNTIKPLADQQKLRIQTYEWHDYDGVKRLLAEQTGKTILICGHGDNLLPIIRNAGAQPPVDSLEKNEYDKLFKLVIRPEGTAKASVETFN